MFFVFIYLVSRVDWPVLRGKLIFELERHRNGSNILFSRKLASFLTFFMFLHSRNRYERFFTKMHKPHMVFFVSQRRSQIWPWFYPEINVYKDPLKKSFDAQSLNHNIYTITQWKCMIQTPNYSTFQALLNPYNNCKN